MRFTFVPIFALAASFSFATAQAANADGAIRVAAMAARQPVLLELLTDDLWIPPHSDYKSLVVDTVGYTRVGFRFAGSTADVRIEWRWTGDAENSFGPVADSSNGTSVSSCRVSEPESRIVCAVSGEALRLAIDNDYDGPVHFESLEVYLIP